MQSKPAKPQFVDLALQPGEWGREDCQAGWHRWAAGFDLGTVLDVGAGLGYSKGRIPNCTTYDPAFGVGCDLEGPMTIPDGSYDTVTAFDVIEHVVEDVDFLLDLCRIARRYVIVTTPNELVSHAANGCHCREYTPGDLCRLLIGWLAERWYVRLFAGTGNGDSVSEYTMEGFLAHTEPHQTFVLERR